ncbi:MAG: N-acetyltransferase [Bacteroidetes bacterium]|nr:MAG: N-acetyltransferase [Bacteroidota bacterium]
MDFETIETSRLFLRKTTQEVMDHVFTSMEPREQMKFLGLTDIQQLQEQERRYNDGLSTFNRKFLYFHLIDKNSQENIGWCGYHTWYIDHYRAEIGYMINESHQRKGLMTEALNAIIPYGFSAMSLNRIEAFIGLENPPSLKLLQNFNFVQEGVLREHYKAKVKPEDSLLFSLLKQDYYSNKK